MATQEKTWNVANRLHSLKDSDNPEVNHIIAGADEIYDDAKGAKQSDINAQTDAALSDRYTKAETYSKEQLDALITTPDVNYVSVATFADLPQPGEADTVYRVSFYDGTQVDASKYALYAWNGATYQLLAVRSAVGEVFDVSEYNSGATYEILSAALAAVPATSHRGGMSIKFIQLTPATYSVIKTDGVTEQPTGTEVQEALSIGTGSYTAEQLNGITLPSAVGNRVTYWIAVTVDDVTTYTTWVITYASAESQEYVQYRLMKTNWSTVAGDWQGVTDEIKDGSRDLPNSNGVVEFTNEKSMYCTPLVDLPLYDKNISGSGQYRDGKHSFIKINPNDEIVIKGSSGGVVNFALTKSHNTDFLDLCDGTSVVPVGGKGHLKTVTLTAPEDAKYLLIGRVVSTVDRTRYIQSIIINGYDVVTSFYNNFGEFEENVNDALSDVQESVGSISNDLYGGDIEVSIVLNTGTFWNSQSTIAVIDNFSSYFSSDPIAIEDDTDYRIEIVTASSTKTNPILIVDENYAILKKYPRGDDHTSVTTFNINKEDFPAGSKYILLTGRSDSSSEPKVYKAIKGVQEQINELQQDVDDINEVISHFGNEGSFDFAGKNIAIIGDSISTNGNYSVGNLFGNVPEIIIQPEDIGVELSAYVTYYDIGVTVGGYEITSEDVGTELTFTPVSGDEGKIVGRPKNNNSAATVVWWEVASEYLGFNPIPVSWSGSSITSHEGDAEELKTSYAWHPAQIRKCGIRTPGTMTRTAPDMIIIYRGTNDFSHSPYTRLTDFLNVYPVSIPESDTFDDGGTTRYGYLEGLAITVNKLREAYPEAQIVVCTFNYFHRVSSGQPSRNGINTIYQYNDAIRAFANYFGCGIIEFDKDGITYANAASGAYYNEGTSPTANHTHPNTKGHKVMGNRAIIDLLKVNSMV